MSKKHTAKRHAAFLRGKQNQAHQANAPFFDVDPHSLDRCIKEIERTEYVTRQQAADLLAVDTRTIDRRIKEGKLRTQNPAVIRGRGGIRILILRADVEALLAEDMKAQGFPWPLREANHAHT